MPKLLVEHELLCLVAGAGKIQSCEAERVGIQTDDTTFSHALLLRCVMEILPVQYSGHKHVRRQLR